jgi:hypothetical protein
MLQRLPAGQTEAAIEHGCLKVFYEKPSALYAFLILAAGFLTDSEVSFIAQKPSTLQWIS